MKVALLLVALMLATSSHAKSKGPAAGPYCKPDPAGHYPSENFVITKKGHDDPLDFDYSEGGGCIARPLREVIAASRNPSAWDWAHSDRDEFTLVKGVGKIFSFLVSYSAGPFFLRQHWLMEYSESWTTGGAHRPAKARIRYRKVKGTDYIKLWRGTIELEALTPGVTSMAMRDEVHAAQTGPEESAKTVHDTLKRLRTVAPNWNLMSPAAAR